MGNKEGNLYCQAIFLNFEGGMGNGWFRVKDGKKTSKNKSPFETIFDPIS